MFIGNMKEENICTIECIKEKAWIQGRVEGKFEDARIMKQKKYSIEEISEITGLFIEDIESL